MVVVVVVGGGGGRTGGVVVMEVVVVLIAAVHCTKRFQLCCACQPPACPGQCALPITLWGILSRYVIMQDVVLARNDSFMHLKLMGANLHTQPRTRMLQVLSPKFVHTKHPHTVSTL